VKPIRDIFRSYGVLDSDGRHINGTDKQTNHSYGDAYESLFAPPYSLRNDVRLMMEVGVADGSCMLAWRDIFPNATIVGMDIHHSDKAHDDRMEFYIGDQRIQSDCERAAAGRQFDLIVEDATHHLPSTLLTLLYLWPFVKPGGLYVVEEFYNVCALVHNIKELWPNVEIVGTCGPRNQDEPLVVFRKP
jgi:trans-aconitate methyltransferase